MTTSQGRAQDVLTPLQGLCQCWRCSLLENCQQGSTLRTQYQRRQHAGSALATNLWRSGSMIPTASDQEESSWIPRRLLQVEGRRSSPLLRAASKSAVTSNPCCSLLPSGIAQRSLVSHTPFAIKLPGSAALVHCPTTPRPTYV